MMNLATYNIWFYLAISYFIYLSYLDIKNGEVENKHFLIILLIAFAFRYTTASLIPAFIIMAFMFLVALLMYSKVKMGGADVKLLIVMAPMLPFFDIPNNFYVIMQLFIIFLIVGTLYALMFKFTTRKREYIPFIPAITLSYMILTLLFH